MATRAKMSKKNAKLIFSIVAATLIAVLVVVGSIFALTGNGEPVAQDTQIEEIEDGGVFSRIEDFADEVIRDEPSLPDNSRDLTDVPEPPTSQADTPDSPHIGVDMRGRNVQQEQPLAAPALNQVSNIGHRFKVPSVGLDVPLGAVNEVDGVINPTNFTSAFTVRNRGVPYYETHTGTAYIVMHALDQGGTAPGNFLMDTDSGQAKVNKGDKVQVGTKDFVVEDSYRAGKELVPDDEDIWSNETGRLVIITCFPDSNDNQVIIAKRDW